MLNIASVLFLGKVFADHPQPQVTSKFIVFSADIDDQIDHSLAKSSLLANDSSSTTLAISSTQCPSPIAPFVFLSLPPSVHLEESTAVGDILSLCFRAAGVSISVWVHPYVHVCMCVHPPCAKILIACKCFF